jgi:hypothetical protein
MEPQLRELDSFIAEWAEGPERNKAAFVRIKGYLQSLTGVSLIFHPRPGVTYSLRARHANQKEKPLFVMVDVIEGQPRWLSVCFYGDMITDPEERGDFVPGGLLGEDGRCFDIEQYEDETISYLQMRMDEACRAAGDGDK